MDGNMTREGMTKDLEAMKRAGIGGVIMMEVDVGVPRGPVRFMSGQWREHFKHAVTEAARLGMKIDLITGPGWTGSGGPWVKPEQSMQHLVSSEVSVRGPRRFDEVLPVPEPREPFFGSAGMPEDLKQARRDYYRDEFVLAFPTPAAGAQIADVDEKALYLRAPYSLLPGVKPFIPAPADHQELGGDQCVERGTVVDLSDRLSPDGRLAWEVPAGDWTIMRFGRRNTGQTTRPAPRPGLGFECDKFDLEALDAHFKSYFGVLLEDVAPYVGKSLVSLHMDSWEISAQNWTRNFQEEFRQRRGYDPLPLLPVMAGVVIDSPEISERFLWDLRQTAQELVIDNHAEHLRDLAHERGLLFSIEPYDMNPCADLSLGAGADVPMCEFWSWGFDLDTDYSVHEAVSIAHTNGRTIVAAEAFTSDSDRWRQYPGRMKAQGDWAFCSGVNRFVFHRWQHQPALDQYPGMTMSIFGVHWERTQTWWEMVGAYHEYLARCQFMLQRGRPVADILYLAPEGAPHIFRPPLSALQGARSDRRGFNFDGCSPEVLLERVSVENGRLVLPDGMTYRVLVLPDFETMTPKLLGRIRDLVRAGATVIGAPPRKSPSLVDYPQCDAEVRWIARELWGAIEGKGEPVERKFGAGRIVLPPAGMPADDVQSSDKHPLESALWIWHSEGRPEQAVPVGPRYFRRSFVIAPARTVVGGRLVLTADNEFDAWVNGRHAGSGDDFRRTYSLDVGRFLWPGANLLAVAAVNGGDTPNPAGLVASLTVQFDDGGTMVINSDRQWRTSPDAQERWRTSATVDGEWGQALELGPLDMAPWNLTDRPASFPDIYPGYDFVAGLLTRDGVAPDLESDIPLRCTHRRDGEMDVYFVGNPEKAIVTTDATFRVSGKVPELWHPLTGECRELPEFVEQAGRTTVPLRFEPHGSFFVVFRKPANEATATGPNFPAFTTLTEVTGPWQVQFQADRGAPRGLTFDELPDWSKHADERVRHFSGVATYRCDFDLSDSQLTRRERGSRIFIDLGRVAVMARVILNGQDLGVVWTPPLHLDITDALRTGTNELEIRVANLWPNRLIGDKALPEDERITSTTWNPYRPDTPLLSSGLLGPVTVQVALVKPIERKRP